MRPLLRPWLGFLAFLALAPPATAATIVTLVLDPSQSSLSPELGSAESLSGTITLRVGSLPLAAVDTTLDVMALAVTASGGAKISLDPDIANPGLGLLTPAGAFLVPTLYVRIAEASSLALPIPDVEGSVVFGPGGVSLMRLETRFGIDTGDPAGVVTVSVVAVPEPASLALLGFGIAALLGSRASRGRQEVSR